MLIAKEISENEKDTWNEFLEKNESGHLFQTFEWGEFKKTQAWKSRRIMLKESETGEIRAVLAILEKRVPLLGLKVWYLPRGPVLDFQNRELLEQILEFLIDLARKNKVMAVKISPEVILSEKTKWILGLLKDKGFKETKHYELHKCTIRLDLTDDIGKIYSGFKKNTRWEIRKAQKDGVLVKRGEDEKDVKIFYQLYSQAMGKDRLPYSYFKNLWETFKEDTLSLIAFWQGIPVSAVFVSSFNKRAMYLFGGTNRKKPTHYASQLLQWEAIKWAKNQGIEVYDFQGIPCSKPKNPHEKGVLQFKDGFSGEAKELVGEFDCAFFPILYQIFCTLNQARIITKGIIGRV